MAELNIVLMNPQIPQNTGNIARTCAVTGARLHLVKPMGFTVSDKHLKRSGLDYWHLLDITYHESIESFFDNTRGGEYYYFSSKGNRKYTDINYPDKCYIVFGSETNGLPEMLLYNNPKNTVRIPMIYNKDARCLNLASSVAVGVYEVLRQWDFPELKNFGHLDNYEWETVG